MYPLPVSRTNVRFDFIVINNHVDNKRKEMLVYVYIGWIVNNRPKNRDT